MQVGDTAYNIFKRHFECRVPYLASLTDDEIEIHGIPYVGDAEYDHYIQNQLVYRYLTINDMVELMRRGVDIRVVKTEDTKAIFEYITEHLRAWKDVVENRVNHLQVPYDDLIDLDKLASLVYPYAKHQFKNRAIDSILAKRASSVSLFDISRITATRPDNNGRTTINDVVDAQQIEEEYQSLTEDFQRRKARVYDQSYYIDKKE